MTFQRSAATERWKVHVAHELVSAEQRPDEFVARGYQVLFGHPRNGVGQYVCGFRDVCVTGGLAVAQIYCEPGAGSFRVAGLVAGGFGYDVWRLRLRGRGHRWSMNPNSTSCLARRLCSFNPAHRTTISFKRPATHEQPPRSPFRELGERLQDPLQRHIVQRLYPSTASGCSATSLHTPTLPVAMAQPRMIKCLST